MIYDITCTVFMTSLPLYLKWHPPHLCHHNDSIGGLRQTVCMTSHPPYICHLIPLYTTWYPLVMTSHHCSYHITSTAFMTSHTLYMTSHTWKYKTYICHLTHYIEHYIHCICVIKPRISLIPHPLPVWHRRHSTCTIIFSMHAITTNVYDIIPLCV